MDITPFSDRRDHRFEAAFHKLKRSQRKRIEEMILAEQDPTPEFSIEAVMGVFNRMDPTIQYMIIKRVHERVAARATQTEQK